MLVTLRADPTTSEEEYFRLALVQTEMERAKFLVRSYVRTRLHKVGIARELYVMGTRGVAQPSCSAVITIQLSRVSIAPTHLSTGD